MSPTSSWWRLTRPNSVRTTACSCTFSMPTGVDVDRRPRSCRRRPRNGSRGRQSNTRERCSSRSVPYGGPTTVLMGLYSNASDRGSRSAEPDHGQRAYKVGQIELLPRTEKHLRDVQGRLAPGRNAARQRGGRMAVEPKKDATLSIRNPKRDVTSTSTWTIPARLPEPQQVTVTIAGQTIDRSRSNPRKS